MPKPTVAATKPAILDIEAGTHYWCSCGLSKKQPFCDGSHQGTEFKPVTFTIDQKKKVVLCQCKHTARAPFCDGSHNKL